MDDTMSAVSTERGRPLHGAYYYILAWVAGFNVMLLEMCGFRVLQTEFGSSIYVTGALLALVMIALSAGYYLGGRASARFGSIYYLVVTLALAAAYVFVVDVMLVSSVLDFCFELRGRFSGPVAINGIPPAIATMALYFPPMLALSQTSPFLVRLIASRRADPRIGAAAGNTMAVSTVGSIVGTLIPSFVLIPEAGVVRTLFVLVFSMLATVIAGGLIFARRRGRWAAASAALILAALGGYAARPSVAATRGERPDVTSVYAGESAYGNIKIFRTRDGDGDEVLFLKPSRTYVHTYVYPARPLKEQFTTLHVSLGYARRAKNYLVLGTALGGAVAAIVKMDPTARVTSVDIDPLMLELARKYVPGLDRPNVEFVAEDARVFLKDTSRSYDYIIVDVFAGEQIPPHCATQEFYELVRSRLTPDGVAVINTNLWDFQVRSGLEETEPFVAVRHVHSALLHAGFPSLFHNDFLEHGEMYAFNRPTDATAVRATLSRLFRDPTADPQLRASAAVGYVGIVPVPTGQADLRPITDEWVPEEQLDLKENFGQYLESLADASDHPRWKQVVEQDRTGSLKLITARYYAELASTVQPSWDGFDDYMRGGGGRRYCEALVAWAEHHAGPLDPELARYFQSSSAPYCTKHLSSMAPRGRRGELLLTYLKAAAKVQDNDGPGALPLLLAFIDQDG
jgi:spermidine synthase